jgi:stage III sporulation protein AH
MEIIDSPDLSKEEKKDAIDGMMKLTDVSVKESAAETLLTAKGFDDAIVFIVDDKVDVVVNSATLSEQQLAIIEDIVKDETGIGVDNIEIFPAVVAE